MTTKTNEITASNNADIKSSNDGLALISKYRGAIMGFAALLIIFFHEWIRIFDNSEIIALYNIEDFIKRTGFCGVDIFLFLSGIGLTFSIKKSNIIGFYYNRLKRIAFPFLAVAILRCCLEKWEITDLLKNISGYNFYTLSIYSFLWFVPAIITLYILFPLYYAVFKKSSNKIIFTIGALGIWLLLSMYFRDDMRNDLFGFTNRIPIFLVGILAGWFCQNKKIIFTKTIWITLVIMLLLGGYLSYLSNYLGFTLLVPVSNCCIPNFLMSISISFLLAKLLDLLTCTKHISFIGKGLTKVLAFFGTFTLEFYCIQEWLGGKIITELQGKASDLAINLIVIAAVTLSSILLLLIGKGIWKLIDMIIAKISPKKS